MLPLGLPFAEVAVSTEWSNWPSLPDLFPKSFPGVKTSRDSFVVDIDFGSGDAVMPGQGRAAARPYTSHECETLAHAANALGNATYDIHLNHNTRWRNILANVWNYKLGGYQILKKWLSYRESKVLGRNLLPEEVQHFTDTARRIAAILSLCREL